jgi:hypothetical protein
MTERSIVTCRDCGHTAEIEVSYAPSRRFRCSMCGGPGSIKEPLSEAGASPLSTHSNSVLPARAASPIQRPAVPNSAESPPAGPTEQRHCSQCGELISAQRLSAVPETRLCRKCAENDPSGAPDRSVSEPWGRAKLGNGIERAGSERVEFTRIELTIGRGRPSWRTALPPGQQRRSAHATGQPAKQMMLAGLWTDRLSESALDPSGLCWRTTW